MEQKYEALAKLFKEEETAKKLMSLSPDEAVSYLWTEYDLSFSVEELKEVAAGMKQAIKEDASNTDELTPEQLELVSGGGSGAYKAGYYIAKGAKIAVWGIEFAITVGVISW